jgi:hypothetical protein
MIHFAPRAVVSRPLIRLEVTPYEHAGLVEWMEARAQRAAEDPDQIDYADYLFRHITELRELGR